MFLFIASEIMLFGSFFTVYFFDRVVNHGVNGQWPPPPFHRPVFVAGVNTLILVTSSFTMHWADTSIKKGNRAGLQAGLVLTLLPRADVPVHAGDRVPPRSASTPATRRSPRRSSGSRACTAPTSSSA